ncbi:MAG: hypothetical protein FWH03_01670 [Firmicutes bacterium]|nr:hypothetical protein [Bacillota bacterium]
MSVTKFLTEYAARKPLRWHTPGHKGTLNPCDLTELADASFPADFVRAAQASAAAFYGAQQARFLTNGSSMGIKAAILAAKGDIIAPSSCHQSVSEAVQLSLAELFCFDTGVSVCGLPNVPSLKDVTDALQKHPSAKAVLLESPDYFGRVISPEIPKAIKKAGKLFFCDAAHGAHFPAHAQRFPVSYAAVADACNLSAHKTLNAYTQAAYLCVNNAALMQDIDNALKNLGTTSPSYLLLSSLEMAVETAKNSFAAYERLYADVQHFKGLLKKAECLQNDDFTRIVVRAAAYSGQELVHRLVKYNLFAEASAGSYAVFIATPHETRADFTALADALNTLTEL